MNVRHVIKRKESNKPVKIKSTHAAMICTNVICHFKVLSDKITPEQCNQFIWTDFDGTLFKRRTKCKGLASSNKIKSSTRDRRERFCCSSPSSYFRN